MFAQVDEYDKDKYSLFVQVHEYESNCNSFVLKYINTKGILLTIYSNTCVWNEQCLLFVQVHKYKTNGFYFLYKYMNSTYFLLKYMGMKTKVLIFCSSPCISNEYDFSLKCMSINNIILTFVQEYAYYRIYPAIRRDFWPSRMTSNK